MKTSIENIFIPYNFSATRCYVISQPVNINGYLKLEHKMPGFIKNINGIFISISCPTSQTKIAGFITLNFNGQALKSFQSSVIRTGLLKDCSHPTRFDETLIPNSLMQGFYYDVTNSIMIFPYELSIYIHYTPQK